MGTGATLAVRLRALGRLNGRDRHHPCRLPWIAGNHKSRQKRCQATRTPRHWRVNIASIVYPSGPKMESASSMAPIPKDAVSSSSFLPPSSAPASKGCISTLLPSTARSSWTRIGGRDPHSDSVKASIRSMLSGVFTTGSCDNRSITRFQRSIRTMCTLMNAALRIGLPVCASAGDHRPRRTGLPLAVSMQV